MNKIIWIAASVLLATQLAWAGTEMPTEIEGPLLLDQYPTEAITEEASDVAVAIDRLVVMGDQYLLAGHTGKAQEVLAVAAAVAGASTSLEAHHAMGYIRSRQAMASWRNFISMGQTADLRKAIGFWGQELDLYQRLDYPVGSEVLVKYDLGKAFMALSMREDLTANLDRAVDTLLSARAQLATQKDVEAIQSILRERAQDEMNRGPSILIPPTVGRR